MTALTVGQTGEDPTLQFLSMANRYHSPFLILNMLTSQILQWSGGDEASASDWEPQALHIGSSLSNMLTLIQHTSMLVANSEVDPRPEPAEGWN